MSLKGIEVTQAGRPGEWRIEDDLIQFMTNRFSSVFGYCQQSGPA
jgi:hypothetical protein